LEFHDRGVAISDAIFFPAPNINRDCWQLPGILAAIPHFCTLKSIKNGRLLCAKSSYFVSSVQNEVVISLKLLSLKIT